jgi:CrcB protein
VTTRQPVGPDGLDGPDGAVGPIGPVPGRPRELADYGRWVLLVIAAGGVIGAELRYGAGVWFSSGPGAFPWATVLVNVVGGLGIGVLMAVLARSARPHPLVRPFLGVGILGGFTTFSTFSTDTVRLIDLGRPELALGYAALTLVAALAATVAGLAIGSAGASAPVVPGPPPELVPNPSSAEPEA